MLRHIQISLALVIGGFALLATLAEEPKPAKPATKHMAYTEMLETPDGKATFDMVAVPGGEFLMGSPESEIGRRDDEGPQVKVHLNPFWIGKHEVSWDEFDLYFRFNNLNLLSDEEKAKLPKKDMKILAPADAVSKPTKPYVDETYGFEREKNPAICMTHHAALKYCEWLSKKTGKDYRLPTEAEWEYACRAGSTGTYGIPKGDKIDDYAWFKGNSKAEKDGITRFSPHGIGTRKPNAWGIYDMHGNVMEWCMDHYVEDAYERFSKLAVKDGFVRGAMFKPTENKWRHVARGGHYKDDLKEIRSAARRKSDLKWMEADPQGPQSIWWLTNYSMIGFRLVRPVEPDELTGITSKVVKENNEEFEPK